MREGKYSDPVKNIEKTPRVACSMCVYVPEGQIEIYDICSYKNKDFRQSFTENKLESVKFTVECYKHYNAGVDFDLIVIDNGTADTETLRYLESLADVTVLHRTNSGFSFGAHKFCWETFRDKYDFYLFNEQDWGPAKDGWLSEIVERFLSDKEIGMVGNFVGDRPTYPIGSIGDLKKILGSTREFLYDLDGCYSFTSSRLLKQLEDHNLLSVLSCEPETGLNAMYNEILWPQGVLELGYKLSSFNDQEHIQHYGVYIKDLENFADKLTDSKMSPIVQGNARFFNDRFKQYFSWYGN